MVRIACIAVALLSFLLAGCGGGGGDNGTPTAAGPRDAEARSLLLTVADFPTGWAENPDDDDDDTPDAVEECIEQRDTSRGRLGFAESGDFERGGSGSVSHSVAIYESAEQLNPVLDGLQARGQCLTKAFNDGKADDDDVEYSHAKFASVSFPAIGESSHAYRLTVHAKAKGESGFGSEADVFLDIVYVTRGVVGFSLVASDVLSPFDSDMLVDLAKKADAKIK